MPLGVTRRYPPLRTAHLQMGGHRPRAGTSLNSLPQRRLHPLRSPQQLLLQPLHLLGNLLQLFLRHQPSRRHLMRLPIRLPHCRTNAHRHPRQPILPSHHSLPKTTPPSYTPITPPPSHTRTPFVSQTRQGAACRRGGFQPCPPSQAHLARAPPSVSEGGLLDTLAVRFHAQEKNSQTASGATAMASTILLRVTRITAAQVLQTLGHVAKAPLR